MERPSRERQLRELLIAKEVAAILRVDVQRVYFMTRERLIPSIKLGARQYRWDADEIEKWLAAGGST